MFFNTQSLGVVALAGLATAYRQNQGQCNAASEKVALATAKTFISLGLKDAGYQYVNIDDCWSTKQRDSKGNLIPDPAKWPRGIKPVADEIHAMGLKFGLYGDGGVKTCAGYPGSQGHEQQDANLLASWGVNYWNSKPRYEKMRDLLRATGRDILYSLCNWGYDEVWTWGAQVGHMWRMSQDNWGKWADVVRIANQAAPILKYSILANGALTPAEERTHFAIWCITKSPIILRTDMTKLNSDEVKLITNKGLLAVNQDSLSKPAVLFTPPNTPTKGSSEIYPYWSGPISTGTVVAIVASKGNLNTQLNLKDVPGLKDQEYSWTELLTDLVNVSSH
ncbi:alpha-galactosidase B [Fusarium agapanthi]|uniref:Alpha-galactosidase n=1 Tax=Fusarium agapanthi TaxID=1803897 RepID=A0A9P5EEW7_9HYPO|nr:alpha-galactosidase B [Fusarium agapanthi]